MALASLHQEKGILNEDSQEFKGLENHPDESRSGVPWPSLLPVTSVQFLAANWASSLQPKGQGMDMCP